MFTSEKEFKRRLSICKSCPKANKHFTLMGIPIIPRTLQCGECKCIMAVKARLEDMYCPLNKWDEEGD